MFVVVLMSVCVYLMKVLLKWLLFFSLLMMRSCVVVGDVVLLVSVEILVSRMSVMSRGVMCEDVIFMGIFCGVLMFIWLLRVLVVWGRELVYFRDFGICVWLYFFLSRIGYWGVCWFCLWCSFVCLFVLLDLWGILFVVECWSICCWGWWF